MRKEGTRRRRLRATPEEENRYRESKTGKGDKEPQPEKTPTQNQNTNMSALTFVGKIKGNITTPTSKQLQNRKTGEEFTLVEMSIAIRDRKEGEAMQPEDFVTVKLIGQVAEAAFAKFKKGDLVEAIGDVLLESYPAKESGRIVTKMVLNDADVKLVYRKPATGAATPEPKKNNVKEYAIREGRKVNKKPDAQLDVDGDDVPF